MNTDSSTMTAAMSIDGQKPPALTPPPPQPPPQPDQKQKQQRRPPPLRRSSTPGSTHVARLCIEYMSNDEAALLSLFVYLSVVAFLCTSLVLVLCKYLVNENAVLFRSKGWYIGNLCIGAVLLAGLLTLASWFLVNLRSTRAARQTW